MLADGAGDLLTLSLHPGEPGRAVRLRRLGELIDVFARQRAAALHGDATHPRSVGERPLKNGTASGRTCAVQSAIVNSNRRSGLSVPKRSIASRHVSRGNE